MSHLNIRLFLFCLVTSVTTLVFIHESWQSALIFVAGLSFAGFVIWLDPERKSQVSREEFQKLQEQVAQAKDDVRATRIKIGLVKP